MSFSAHGIPVLLTLFIWWFSTGIILYLDGLPKHTYRWSFLGTTIIAAAAFAGLIATRDTTTVSAAYIVMSPVLATRPAPPTPAIRNVLSMRRRQLFITNAHSSPPAWLSSHSRGVQQIKSAR
jgi:Protein of unknown function (DUF3623)